MASKKQPAVVAGHKSPMQLLHGFFQYYANFDYDTQVISLYAGQILAKDVFKKEFENPNDENLQTYWEKVSNGEDILLHVESELCIQVSKIYC
jgi:hypothetical protein